MESAASHPAAQRMSDGLAGQITRAEELAYELKIAEVMTPDPRVVAPNTGLADVLELLRQARISGVPKRSPEISESAGFTVMGSSLWEVLSRVPTVNHRHLAEAITAQRIDLFLEPVCELAERRPQHSEFSVRLRTRHDESLGASDYVSVARGTGMLPLLDALRRRAGSEGVSLNELIRRLVRDGLSRDEAHAVPPPAANRLGDDTGLRRSA